NELKLRVPTLSQERKAASRRSERRCFGGTRRGLRAGHVVKGDNQELGRPEALLTEREPDGGTGIEKPPARGEGIGATGANSDAGGQVSKREAESQSARDGVQGS
ncbi:MAG: hypothetical protein ACREX9_21710, partial [Gammaproteobacteria bacterium]